ncbi:MAG: hypothetical protein KBT34_09910 [Prevotella sp.]|nr:hypothetical protein [Candidatus Prevotella equi]
MQRSTTNNVWYLPETIFVDGKEYAIRTDFRVVLDLFTALSDPEMVGETESETNEIRARLMLEIMIPEYDKIEDKTEAINQICEFVDMGEGDSKPHPKVMDWQQDAKLIIPAVNKVIGHDIRMEKHMHWWTFLSAYMEIGESTFSHVLHLRQKKAKGKKLEKWEQEFIRENKDLVILKDASNERDEEEKEELRKLLY